MTLEESIRQQEKITERMRPLSFVTKQQEILNRIAATYSVPPGMTAAVESFSLAAAACANAFSVPDYSSVIRERLERIATAFTVPPNYYQEMTATLSASLESLATSIEKANLEFRFSLIADGLSQTVQRAFDLAMPYMPEQQRHEFEAEIAPNLDIGKERHLSLNTLLSIFMALMALLTFIFTIMPDSQSTRIIEQNDKIISLEEERLELERERGDNLDDVVYALTDAINSLSNEIENMRNLTEDSDDSTVPPSQPSEPDSENQNGD